MGNSSMFNNNPDHMALIAENESLRELLEEARDFMVEEGYVCHTEIIRKIDVALGYAEEEES